MNEPAPWGDDRGPGPAGRLIECAVRVGSIAAAYLILAGLIWACDAGAVRLGVPMLRFGGLVLDIVLLTWLGVWLGRRGHPIGGTIGPLVALLLIVLLFSAVDRLMHGERASFWSVANLRMIAVQTSTVAVAALGMTMIIIAGGIDLSVGTTLALSATVLAFGLDSGWGMVASIAACLATGFAAGLVNGSLTSLLGVVPFIITLGTMSVYLGIGKLVAKETTVRPPPGVVPSWLPKLVTPFPRPAWLLEPLVPNFGWGVWLAGGLAVLLAVLLHRTVFGRHVFAIGSSESTARLCGINVTRTKVLVYALAGLFVGVAGLYQFARLTEGSPTAGLGAELKIIAAVVIGGGSLTGGRGSVVGTLTGAAIMLVIASGCTALGLKNPMQDIIIGVIIVAAVTLDQVRQRRLLAS
jgi:ribose transport system permease protein